MAKKTAAPATTEKPKVERAPKRPDAVLLAEYEAKLEKLRAEFQAAEANYLKRIEACKTRLATNVETVDVTEVVKAGLTPEQLRAQARALLAQAKKLGGMTEEELAALAAEVEAGDEPSAEGDSTEG